MVLKRKVLSASFGITSALALSACSDAKNNPGTAPGQVTETEWAAARASATPVAATDFCSTLSLAVCDAMESCCSDPLRKYPDRAQCLSSYDACNEYEAPVPYDAMQAGAIVQLYRQSAQNCSIPVSLTPPPEAQQPSVTTYPCDVCKEGTSCVINGAEVSCVTQLGFGAECTVSRDCTTDLTCFHMGAIDGVYQRTCQPRSGLGGSCSEMGDCVTGLRCVGGDRFSVEGSTGICQPLAMSGEECSYYSDCAEGLLCWPAGTANPTLTVCAAPGPAGFPCEEDDSCAEGLICLGNYVDYFNDGTAGLNLLGACSPCESHQNCGDRRLVLGQRYGNFCSEGACIDSEEVVGVLTDGAACVDNHNCSSGWCSSGTCITPTRDELYCRAN